MSPFIGVDIGGTKIACGLMTPEGGLVTRVDCATPAAARADQVIEVVSSQVRRTCHDAEVEVSQLLAVGVGLPGAFDADGTVLTSPNIPAFVGTRPERDFGDALTSAFGRALPVVSDNDCCCALVAEARLGVGAGFDPLIYLTVSTGVGGARLENGEIVNLEPGLSLFPDPRQPERSLESLAGGAGLAAAAHQLGIDARDARGLAEASAAGDEVSLRLLEGSADAVGGAIDLLLAPDPASGLPLEKGDRGEFFRRGRVERIVIGGSIALGVPWYIQRVTSRSRFGREFSASTPLLVPTSLAGDQGILGAALLARQRFLWRRDHE